MKQILPLNITKFFHRQHRDAKSHDEIAKIATYRKHRDAYKSIKVILF